MSAPPRIGYYVHHHGAGHAARATAIARELRCPVTFLSSRSPGELGAADLVPLPLDTDPDGRDVAPADLHFAPLGSSGLRERMAAIAAWIESARPQLFVVDVSVEVASLVRLCGVPVVYVRQSGRRGDPAHRRAYEWAERLLAPYPRWLEPGETPNSVLERTFHAGAITRFDGRPRPNPDSPRGRRVLAIGDGAAGLGPPIATAAPDWEVLSSADGGSSPPPNLRRIRSTDVDLELLASCAVVVAPAGANTVAEAGFCGCGLVCLPQPRPFEEQVARGRDLERLGAAVVLDREPAPERWPRLLEQALERRAGLAEWADGEGAARAAAFLDELLAQTVASSSPAGSSQWTSPAAESSRSQPVAGQLPQRPR